MEVFCGTGLECQQYAGEILRLGGLYHLRQYRLMAPVEPVIVADRRRARRKRHLPECTHSRMSGDMLGERNHDAAGCAWRCRGRTPNSHITSV